MIRQPVNILFVFLGFFALAACSGAPQGEKLDAGTHSVWIGYEPDPLEVGEQARFTVTVRDAAGGEADDCQVRFLQTMPGMEMSTDNVYVVLAPAGSGRYLGMSHEFHMGGDWVLSFELTCGDGETRTLKLERHLEWPE